MKVLKGIAIILCALAAFVIGVLFFAPWESIGLYAFDTARQRAQENGIYLGYDGLTASGGLQPTFSIRAIEIDSPFSQAVLNNVRLTVFPFRSAAFGGASFAVEFSGGTLKLVPNISISIGGGRAVLTATRRQIRADSVEMGGDMKLSGSLMYDLEAKRILESTVQFAVPDNISVLLRNPLLSRFVEQTPTGEWRIRYGAQNR